MRRLLLASSLASLASLATLATGCICTEMYAPDTISVQLPTAPTTGKTEIKVQSTSGTPAFETCTIDFGLPDPEAGCRGNGKPDAELFATQQVRFTFEGDPPAEVTVSIRVDDGPAQVTTHKLSYSNSEPNGRGCGVRSVATITL